MTDTYLDKLIQDLEQYLLVHPGGGNLHIVVEDFNLGDQSVHFCIDSAAKDNDMEGFDIACALAGLTLEQRGAVITEDRCKTCGHASVLHSAPNASCCG